MNEQGKFVFFYLKCSTHFGCVLSLEPSSNISAEQLMRIEFFWEYYFGNPGNKIVETYNERYHLQVAAARSMEDDNFFENKMVAEGIFKT